MNLIDAIKTVRLFPKEEALIPLETRWGKNLDDQHVLEEYPRPQMIRNNYINLNGYWDYAITPDKSIPPQYQGKILVPFSPEASLSKVNKQLQPNEYLWYQRTLPICKHRHKCCLLHFGAVDQTASIYINQKKVFHHVGGYLPFTIDITRFLNENSNILTVRVQDVSETSYQSIGKQRLKRGGMYYTAQSGIWQTVWLEWVSETYIQDVKITPDYDHNQIEVKVFLNQPTQELIHFQINDENIVSISSDQNIITQYLKIDHKISWTPDSPYLYNLHVSIVNDHVKCYFAMRLYTIEKDKENIPRICLNHQPIFMNGVLDQGYWPDGLYTAPSDEALIYDIQTMKDLGFNMLRKHGKIETDRWYFHCDRMGMLVWQDMPNGGSSYHHWFVTYLATLLNWMRIPVKDLHARLLSRTDEFGRQEYIDDIRDMVRTLYNHPSIVTWVPFNEGWGQFSTKKVTDFIHRLDPSRLVDSASGWFDQGCGDINSLHYYFLGLPVPESDRVLALSEFGGYSLRLQEHSACKNIYGYKKFTTSEALTDGFSRLMENTIVPSVKKGYSATVFTQLSDIEEETNGLITYDRKKIKMNPLIVQKWNTKLKKSLHS